MQDWGWAGAEPVFADATPPACTKFGATIVSTALGACPEIVVSLLALHFALECWTENEAAVCQGLAYSAVSAPPWPMSDPFEPPNLVMTDVLCLDEAYVFASLHPMTARTLAPLLPPGQNAHLVLETLQARCAWCGVVLAEADGA